MVGITAVIKSRIPQIMATGDTKAAIAVAKAANNIVSIAADKSRYRSGNMRGGWQQQEIPGGAGHARMVFNNVHYTIYHEYGTIHMPAQPMLGPAIAEVEPGFKEEVADGYK